MNIQRILIIKCTYKKIQLPCTFPSIYMFTTLYSIFDEKQHRVEDTSYFESNSILHFFNNYFKK